MCVCIAISCTCMCVCTYVFGDHLVQAFSLLCHPSLEKLIIIIIIITGVSNPRKFSSELVIPCPSAKLFHLERFAIYGIC